MQEVCATIKNFVDKGIVALTLLHTDIGDCWNSYVCLVQFCEVLVVAFALYWLDDYMIEIQGCMIMICYMSLACYACVFRLKPMHLLTFCL